MADARSLAPEDEGAVGRPSPMARKLRAFWRNTGRLAQRMVGRQPIEGFVDGVRSGEIKGWAFDPNQPSRRVHVVARFNGKVVGEALADLSRRDLIQKGCGDGRHAFSLKLHAAVMDGATRQIRVAAESRWGRTRLIGGDVLLGLDPDGDASTAGQALAPLAAVRQGAPARVTGEGRAALLLWGDGTYVDESLRDWSAQAWPDLVVGRLGAPLSGVGADATFGPDDVERLRAFVRSAHTVVLARAGDRIDPSLARLVVQTRPLCDVLTWTASSAAGRRPEARALGVLLGESLEGAVAVRRHVLGSASNEVLRRLAAGRPRGLELWAASQTALRWAHLPAELTGRPSGPAASAPLESSDAQGLEGFVWLQGDGTRPGRLAPARPARRITLAVWPQTGTAHHSAIDALIAGAPDAEIEILAPAGTSADHVARWRELSGAAVRDRLTVRAIDAPASSGVGAWLSTLGKAATGEVVVFCQAGVRPPPGDALGELAAWSLSPLVGAATMELRPADAGPLAGLALSGAGSRWSLISGFDPARAGQARPVLAAPAEFMALSRAKLAAFGGFDDRRFPEQGAEFDLALRLRRAGHASMLLGGAAKVVEEVAPRPMGARLAGFDPAELAAAAYAYPGFAGA